MADRERIVFLGHSGFLMELSDCVLIFDAAAVAKEFAARFLKGKKPVYFFVSHAHADHFNPKIYEWADRAGGYFVHRDCAPANPVAGLQAMDVGDTMRTREFSVRMYGSTDEGGSFWIEHAGQTFFHAGDLNWWHWAGERDEDNEEARSNYFRVLDTMKGLSADVVFFPVDARQEAAREWGVWEFLTCVPVRRLLVPMHAFGTRWCPSYAFRWRWGHVPLWIPEKEGAEIQL